MEPKYNEPRTIGRYSLLSRIASGGMGEIHLARLSSMQGVERYFAIKLLLPQFATEKTIVDMFVTEARIAARIQHPNVCQVYELGTENDELFICMEFLQGISVSAILQSHTSKSPIPVSIATSIIEQACSGLQFAHDLADDAGKNLGVVHRDVSPGNLFLTSSGVAKVLDFGVVKANDKTVKTQTGVLKGKMGYMSPEQITGKIVDRRSDIFSLGIVLFELLTNRRLFSRETEFYTLKAILEEPVTKLRERRPDLPEELEEVVSRALCQDINERYSSMNEFRDALKSTMASHGGLASSSDISNFVRKKYANELEKVSNLLRYEESPVPTSTEVETAVYSSPSSSGDSRDTKSTQEEVSQTAPVTPHPFPTPKSKAAVWALVLLGGAILSLAAAIFLKKDKEVATPQAIVFEGHVSREGSASGAQNNQPLHGGIALDAGVQFDSSDTDTKVSSPSTSKCDDKPTTTTRNTCKVTQKGRELRKCLKRHAVDIGQTPQLTLNFFLTSRGAISNVDVSPVTIGNSSLGKCVKRVASTIRFGVQEGSVKFSVPLRINQ